MATQAVISVVQEGKVIYKIIAGCNGHNAQAFAQYLRAALSERIVAPVKIYRMAEQYDLGSEHDLVVLSAGGEFHKCGEELSPLYRKTFNRPNFNPRWEQGTADHVIIIDLDK